MSISQLPFTVGMKRIQFSAIYPKQYVHPIHQKIIEGTSIQRAELLMWSPTEDATTLFWCDGELEATRTVFDEISSLVERNFVRDVEGTYAFLQQDAYEFSSAILNTIADSRVIFLPPVVFLDTGTVEFEAVGTAEALSSFHDDLSEIADLTIEQVQEFERKHSPTCLTDRQRAALDAAVSLGYYEVPREGTVSDIADLLDCSTSTAGELVRKAEAAVVQNYTKMN